MKVVLATHHFPPRYVGGVELITLRLARWLTRQGHDVEVVCVESVSADGGARITVERGPFENLVVNRLALGLQPGFASFRTSYDNRAVGQWFEAYLRRQRPDLVHVHSGHLLSSSTIRATRRVELPLVISLHDYWFLCPQVKLLRPDGRRCHGNRSAAQCAWCLMTWQRRYRWSDGMTLGLAGWAMGHLARRRWLAGHPWGRMVARCRERQRLLMHRLESADVVTSQSRFLCQCVLSAGLSPGKMRLVPYGLDLGAWPPTVRRAPCDEALRIGYLGQVLPSKGAHLLVEAFLRLDAPRRQAHLTIYGHADQQPGYGARLRRLARGSPHVTFAGRYENHRLPHILAGLDVVVVPSLWFETGPLVTLEAFAAGVPVVAADLPNMNAQVTHGVNGLLFRPGSARRLAGQLQRLIDEPATLESLRSGIGPVRSCEQEAGEMMDIYREVTGH